LSAKSNHVKDVFTVMIIKMYIKVWDKLIDVFVFIKNVCLLQNGDHE